MEQTLGVNIDDVVRVSAKSGINIDLLLDSIVDNIKPPTGDPEAMLQAMVFDSHYDEYRGAITYVRIMNGTVKKGDKVQFVLAGTTHEVIEIGQFTPKQTVCEQLSVGQVGYLVCNIKSLDQVNIGDTDFGRGQGPRRSVTRLPGTQADGLLRAVSVRWPGFYRTP